MRAKLLHVVCLLFGLVSRSALSSEPKKHQKKSSFEERVRLETSKQRWKKVNKPLASANRCARENREAVLNKQFHNGRNN